MLPMKEILGAQFWNQEVESTRSLDAVVCSLPSEPPPLSIQQSSRISRSQQLLLLQRFLAVPCTPSYAVDTDDGGGWVLDRVLASAGGRDWWVTLTGRIRAQRLWVPGRGRQESGEARGASGHGEEAGERGGPPCSSGRGWASRLQDASLYALCGRGRWLLGPGTSLSASAELHSFAGLVSSPGNGRSPAGRVPWRGRITLLHKLRKHEVALESAWHQSCVDREARYWDVPHSLALDLASRGAPGGLRYRLGVHRSAGIPKASDQASAARAVPWGARPGTRAQAAVALEREVALWKGPLRRERTPLNRQLSARPRVTLSGMCGGLLNANLSCLQLGAMRAARSDTPSPEERTGGPDRAKAVSADLFASAGVTAKLGRFERLVLDYTVVGVRVDCGAASAFAAAASQSSSGAAAREAEGGTRLEDRGCPTVAVSLQQQVLGPLRARFDTRFALDPARAAQRPRILETTYGVDLALGKLGAAKLVAWYSPTRREGMAEIRLLER